MKYIVFEADPLDYAMLFSRHISHYEVSQETGEKVLSAGFCRIHDGEVVCYGDSYTLDVKSRPAEDAELIMLQFNQ